MRARRVLRKDQEQRRMERKAKERLLSHDKVVTTCAPNRKSIDGSADTSAVQPKNWKLVSSRSVES